MTISFDSIDTNFTTKEISKKRIWLSNLAKLHGRKIDSLLIHWCSDNFILDANIKYLGHNYCTDIITFDNSSDTPGFLSGELLISVDTVRNNAKIYSQKFHVEQLRVLSHGLLHLIGYDDKTESQSKLMRVMEDIAINLYDI